MRKTADGEHALGHSACGDEDFYPAPDSGGLLHPGDQGTDCGTRK